VQVASGVSRVVLLVFLEELPHKVPGVYCARAARAAAGTSRIVNLLCISLPLTAYVASNYALDGAYPYAQQVRELVDATSMGPDVEPKLDPLVVRRRIHCTEQGWKKRPIQT
jgi:hypothetical protein